MSLVEALLLGVVQGLTEFLPVSSSGHLLFASRLLGLRGDFIDFAVASHMGSLAAVLLFVRGEIATILKRLDAKSGLKLALATLPAAVLGLLFKEAFVPRWGWQLSAAFAVTASLCATMPQRKEGQEWRMMGLGSLLFVGSFQAASLVPGISRSGSTVWAGLVAKLGRREALNFSFLLAAIAIGGAAIIRAKNIAINIRTHPVPTTTLILASFFSSLLALYLLRLLLLRLKLWLFTPYLLCLSLLSAIFL